MAAGCHQHVRRLLAHRLSRPSREGHSVGLAPALLQIRSGLESDPASETHEWARRPLGWETADWWPRACCRRTIRAAVLTVSPTSVNLGRVAETQEPTAGPEAMPTRTVKQPRAGLLGSTKHIWAAPTICRQKRAARSAWSTRGSGMPAATMYCGGRAEGGSGV